MHLCPCLILTPIPNKAKVGIYYSPNTLSILIPILFQSDAKLAKYYGKHLNPDDSWNFAQSFKWNSIAFFLSKSSKSRSLSSTNIWNAQLHFTVAQRSLWITRTNRPACTLLLLGFLDFSRLVLYFLALVFKTLMNILYCMLRNMMGILNLLPATGLVRGRTNIEANQFILGGFSKEQNRFLAP